jgi:hypothetical protein
VVTPVPSFRSCLLLLAGLPLAACSSPGSPAGEGLWRWPEESRPHAIRVELDTLPARTALELLAGEGTPAALVEAAVETAASRGLLRSISLGRDEWRQRLLAARKATEPSALGGTPELRARRLEFVTSLESDRAAIERDIARRVERLLADSPRVELTFKIVFVLGTDQLAVGVPLPPEVGEGIFVDPARLFADVESGEIALLAGQVVRTAAPALLAVGRERQGLDLFSPAGGSREKRILARLHAEGPGRYLALGDDFLPLTRWLAGPLRESWSRFAGSAADAPTEPPDLLVDPVPGTPFWQEDAALAGAVMTDGIVVVLGPTRLREALSGGPAPFALAYEEARRKDGGLWPLPPRILDAARSLAEKR